MTEIRGRNNDAAWRWTKARSQQWITENPANRGVVLVEDEEQAWGVRQGEDMSKYKAVRVFLRQFKATENDLEKINQFLEKCCSSSGDKRKAILVLLDDPFSTLYESPSYYPSVFLQGASTRLDLLEKIETPTEIIQPYVTSIIQRFGNDTRVLAIDLWNDPYKKGHQSYRSIETLLAQVYEWARSASGWTNNPLILGGVSPNDDDPALHFSIQHMDLLAFSCNKITPNEITDLQEKYGRPVICTDLVVGDRTTLRNQQQLINNIWTFEKYNPKAPLMSENADSDITKNNNEASIFLKIFVALLLLMNIISVILCLWEFFFVYTQKRKRSATKEINDEDFTPSVIREEEEADKNISLFLQTCRLCLNHHPDNRSPEVDTTKLEELLQREFPSLGAAWLQHSNDFAVADVFGRRPPLSHSRLLRFVQNEMGRWLRQQFKIDRRSRVAVVMMPNTPVAAEMAVCIVAVSYWASCVPIVYNNDSKTLEELLVESDAKLVIGIGTESTNSKSTGSEMLDKKENHNPFWVMRHDQTHQTKSASNPFQQFFEQFAETAENPVPVAASRLGITYASLVSQTDDETGIFRLDSSMLEEEGANGNDDGIWVPNTFSDEALVFLSKNEQHVVSSSYTLGNILMVAANVGLVWNLKTEDINYNMMPLDQPESVVHQLFSTILSGGCTVLPASSKAVESFWALLIRQDDEINQFRSMTWYCADGSRQETILETAMEHDDDVKLRIIALADAGNASSFLSRQLNSTFGGAKIVLAHDMDEYIKTQQPAQTDDSGR